MTAAEFLADYVRLIDVVALIALGVLAVMAFYRKRTLWLWLLGIVVIIWVAGRLFMPV